MTNAGYGAGSIHDHDPDLSVAAAAGADIRYGETFAGAALRSAAARRGTPTPTGSNDVAARDDRQRGEERSGRSRRERRRCSTSRTAFDGRRLCEKGVGTLEEQGLVSWTAPGASDKTEWVERIRVETGVTGTPYFIQESLHPNWWGQLALRNCVRQAYNGGKPIGGTCTRGGDGLNASGEPFMVFLGDGRVSPNAATPDATVPTPGPAGTPSGAPLPSAPTPGAFPIPEGELPQTW